MKLNETLQLLALQLNLDPAELIRYADEDKIGGWDLDQGGWPVGSMWSVEGQTIYALIRALKPLAVMEIGGWRGCSATHIATALQINDKGGELVSVDLTEGAGDLLPDGLRDLVKHVADDGATFLRTMPDNFLDIIFEDADHSTETSRAIAELAKSKLKPGGLLIVHDAGHDWAWLGDRTQITSDVGETIRRGLTMALGNTYHVYRADPSDCGLAVWQKPAKAKPQGLSGDDGYTRVAGDPLREAIEQVKAGEWSKVSLPVDTPEEEAERNEKLNGSFDDMTKVELLEYAAAHDIQLTSTRNKPVIVAQIIEAQTAQSAD